MINARREALETQIKQHEAHIENLKAMLAATPKTHIRCIGEHGFTAIIENRQLCFVDKEAINPGEYICIHETVANFPNQRTGRRCVVQVLHEFRRNSSYTMSIKQIGMTS